MTPVFLFLFFLILMAVLPCATGDHADIIERVNDGISTRLVHGDLKQNLKRNAIACTAKGCKWPKHRNHVLVPISISSKYTTAERNTIIRGLLTFHKHTCIRFVLRHWVHRQYIHFFPGTGCWSSLGRQSQGQLISLKKGENSCVYTDIVQHEVLHALGFQHEQVRSDRDNYVSILTQNIKPGKEHNFKKVQTNNLGTPYDFNSIMHYGNYAFSKNKKPTIIAKSNPEMVLGGATEMTANDIARVNKLYQCFE